MSDTRNAPPNVVALCLNEWRHDAAGFAGDPNARTPHMDAIAQRGVIFRHAVVDNLDSVQNRRSLLATLGEAASSNRYDMTAAGWLDPLVCAENGYERIAVTHASPVDSLPAHAWAAFGAARSTLSEQAHPITRCGDEAVRLLRTAREPFLLALPFPAPTTPLDPPAPWDRLLRPDLLALPARFTLPARTEQELWPMDFSTMTEARFRKNMACYYGMLAYIDHQIGRILATLAGRGFGRTVILLTAAGGHYLGEDGRTAREAQPQPCPALMRVPLVVAGLGDFASLHPEAPISLSQMLTLLAEGMQG